MGTWSAICAVVAALLFALEATTFVAGIPLFLEATFLLLAPAIGFGFYGRRSRAGRIGLAGGIVVLLAALAFGYAVTHLPPHPPPFE